MGVTREDNMRRSVIALALGATIIVSGAGAQAAPKTMTITACQTISQPGSYELESNLHATGDCLVIAHDSVTIDLAGFSITGSGGGNGIVDKGLPLRGIAVRNGSISNFENGVVFSGGSSDRTGVIVEGLRVFQNANLGIRAAGITKNNIVLENHGIGIDNEGSTVTGNYVAFNNDGIQIFDGVLSGNTVNRNSNDGIIARTSTLIGNTAISNGRFGIWVQVCPSNVLDNTAVGNINKNIDTTPIFAGTGSCNNIFDPISRNVAP
jgi:parallel beta-helix repeat protein